MPQVLRSNARQIAVNKRVQADFTGSCKGTGYHTEFRMEVAVTVKKGLKKNAYYLDEQTNAYVKTLLDAGLSRGTITRWMDKYANCRQMFFVIHKDYKETIKERLG